MPYDSVNKLPESVKNNLPRHAQEIYKEAFNSAHKQHSDKSNTEERSHKIAWDAVKNSYHKNDDGEWVEDDN